MQLDPHFPFDLLEDFEPLERVLPRIEQYGVGHADEVGCVIPVMAPQIVLVYKETEDGITFDGTLIIREFVNGLALTANEKAHTRKLRSDLLRGLLANNPPSIVQHLLLCLLGGKVITSPHAGKEVPSGVRHIILDIARIRAAPLHGTIGHPLSQLVHHGAQVSRHLSILLPCSSPLRLY